MKIKLHKTIPIIVFLASILLLASDALAVDVKRMTVKELDGILGNDKVVVLDVRAGRDWGSSEFKIKGAYRADPGDFKAWAEKFPKDHTLVLYCA